MSARKGGYAEIGPESVDAWLDRGARLVDVRERWEHERGHLPGAENVPLSGLLRWVRETGPGPVVLVCATGNRSGKAARRLAAEGLPDVANLAGGTAGWAERGLPVVAGDLPDGGA